MCEQLELFPDYVGEKVVSYRQKDSKEYAEFLEKFDNKKTTDDCFTPSEVYDVVLRYALELDNARYKGYNVVRTFYPGGDYKSVDYTGSVVVDNPPFSILMKIVDFYLKKNVPFFLFAPFNTCISKRDNLSTIIAGARITYANGADVRTCFVTNFLHESSIVISSKLRNDMESVQRYNKDGYAVNEHHPNVTSAAMLCKYSSRTDVRLYEGTDYEVVKQPYDSYRLFGDGVILSDNAVMLLNSPLRLIDDRETEQPIRKITRKLNATAKAVLDRLNSKNK